LVDQRAHLEQVIVQKRFRALCNDRLLGIAAKPPPPEMMMIEITIISSARVKPSIANSRNCELRN